MSRNQRFGVAIHAGRRIALALFLVWSNLTSTVAGDTILAIDGSQFTLNGKPTFPLGVSYYGGLGAPAEFVRQDLEDVQRYGFNWLRVWATWENFDSDVSAVDAHGQPRQPFMDKLISLIAECDRRGLVVDVTLSRGKETARQSGRGRLLDFESHQRAVEGIVSALGQYRNWYLDLANERDVRDTRYVSPEELKFLRDLVRRVDSRRIVTASFGGHDINERDVRDTLLTAELDFLSLHRPRNPESPAQTETRTRQCLALAKEIDRVVPIHHQEPFRRGYAQWEPGATDFLTDLRGAVTGGAAGWCFHNGSQRATPDNEPRRSFDLRTKRLFDQLDAEERIVVSGAAALVQQMARQ